MTKTINCTLSQNNFSIDNAPTSVAHKDLGGEGVFFESPDGTKVAERYAAIETASTFNGTALLTASAVNDKEDALQLDDISYDHLHAPLIVLDLAKGTEYTREKLQELIENQIEKDKKYILLLRTGIMDLLLKVIDKNGSLNTKEKDEIRENHPSISEDGAKYLSELNFASAIMIDDVSVETQGSKGFLATQALMGIGTSGEQIPLVYHTINTGNALIDEVANQTNSAIAHIGLGNYPTEENLSGYPVSIHIEEK